MAKQPEIQIGGVSAPATASPQMAVSKSLSKMNLVTDTFNQVNKVATQFSKDQADLSLNDHKKALTDYQVWASQNETLTRDKLEEMGIADNVNTKDYNGNDLQYIPRDRWYAQGMQVIMDKSKTAGAGVIASAPVRRAWEQSVDQINNEMLAKAFITQEGDALVRQEKEILARFETAMSTGDFDTAKGLLESETIARMSQYNPAVVQGMRVKVDKGVEIEGLTRRIMTTDRGQLEAVIEDMANPEFMKDSLLTATEQRGIFSAAYSRLALFDQNEKDAKSGASDQKAMYYEKLLTSSPGEFDINQVYADGESGVLNQRDFEHVVSIYRSQVSQGADYKTPLEVDKAFEGRAYDLEMGLVDDGVSYDQAVEGLAKWVSEQIKAGTLAPNEIDRYGDRVRELKKAPYENPEYKLVVQELQQTILGYDPDKGGFGIGGSDARSVDYQDAKNDLISWMRKNGGAAADLQEWRDTRMGKHLKKAALSAYLGIPEKTSRYVRFAKGPGGNDVPDKDLSLGAIREELAKQGESLNKVKETGNQNMIDTITRQNVELQNSVVELEAYFDGIGKYY